MKLYEFFLQSTGVSTDTRQLRSGELFFCLRGDNFDGNRFALEALRLGAALVVVDNAEVYDADKPMMLVEDSLQALQALAKYHRQQFSIPVLGITGTNGKTTTKELTAAVLSKRYTVLFTQGNFNNHIGVPLTLLQLKKKHQLAVIEMGANHAGEIAFLCDMVQPTHGIITNVGRAHLEGFGTYDTVLQTKLALYHAVAQRQGVLFVNVEDEVLQKHLPAEVLWHGYALHVPAEVRLKLLPDTALRFVWRRHEVQTCLFGKYNAYNAAAALSIGKFFGVATADMIDALQLYVPHNNRSQIVRGDSNTLVMDAYNANPESMQRALDSFVNDMPGARKMVVLGDMMELGAFAQEAHRQVLEALKDYRDKMATHEHLLVMLVGEHFAAWAHQYTSYTYFDEVQAAEAFFEEQPFVGYSILLKGSRSVHLERLQNILA